MLPVGLSKLAIEPVFTIKSERNTGGLRTTTGVPGHYFVVTMTTRLLNHRQARELSAWVAALEGYRRTEIVLPVASEPLGTAIIAPTAPNGLPQINALDPADGRRIQLRHFQANQLSPLAAGDYIRIGAGKKVYKVADCTASDDSGLAWLRLHAPLLSPVPDNGDDVQIRPAFCLAPEGKLPRINEGGNKPESYTLTFSEDHQT